MCPRLLELGLLRLHVEQVSLSILGLKRGHEHQEKSEDRQIRSRTVLTAEGSVVVPVPIKPVGVIPVLLDFAQEEGGFTSFGQVSGLRVRLDDVVMNLPRLAPLFRPLLAEGNKVRQMREVFQRAAGEVRRLGIPWIL